MMTKRGVTLIELLVAMIVATVLLTMAIRIQAATEQVGRGRLERIGAAAGLRAVAKLVRWEWAGLGIDSLGGPDFSMPGAGRIAYRGQTGLLSICRLSGDTLIVDPSRLEAWRVRLPLATRDSLLVYLPGDSASRLDAWLPVALVAGPDHDVCPGGGSGRRYRIAWSGYAGPMAAQTVARSYEPLELRAYLSGASWQLGQAGLASGGVVQPAVGPLAGSGFALSPVGADGVPSGVLAATGIDVRVRLLTGRETAVGPGRAPQVEDSLRLFVRLGNVP
ncbi:MAG: type II secretion system protein [Gemmatimonadales bacterium]